MTQLIELSGKEFMQRLLQGERDFNRKKFTGQPLTTEEMSEINAYLKTVNLVGEPVILDLADISGISFPGIYAPHTRARGVKAIHARLPGAILSHADLGPYTHPNRTQTRSDLSYAVLNRAELDNSTLNGAIVIRTGFEYTNLWDAKMEDMRGLERALYLESTNMRSAQRASINAYIQSRRKRQ
ncbi:MAG: pentapeptide repeat-containing protein [Candidatus Aenigmarchaeota archaeon]|nr:pentapeptide repeat-containing protein [Candidatus Aenigmarchaeota archaeon]